MSDIIKPQVLVRGAKIQNRGKQFSGKDRFYTRIECTYSGIVGTMSANIIGQVAVAEAIDVIRERWMAGKTAGGDYVTISGVGWTPDSGVEMSNYKSRRTTTQRRFINARVIEEGPGEKNMEMWAKNDNSGNLYKMMWSVYNNWYTAVKALYTMRRVFSRVGIDGIKTRDRLKLEFIPDYAAPAFASSGLMIASLRGAVERKRSYELPAGPYRPVATRVDVEAGFSLMVDPKRSGCAVKQAGLNIGDLSKVVNRETCPRTADLMDHLIDIESDQKTMNNIIRITRLAVQGMQWVGGL